MAGGREEARSEAGKAEVGRDRISPEKPVEAGLGKTVSRYGRARMGGDANERKKRRVRRNELGNGSRVNRFMGGQVSRRR